MANITYDTRLSGPKTGLLSEMKTRIVKFRRYRKTLDELRSLSDRELSDLGIPRCELRAIAHEAAYGA